MDKSSLWRWWTCMVVLVAALSGCAEGEAAPAGRGMIVVSGDTGGWIMPCGCASNQSGGLMRRGTFVEQLREQGTVVYLDAGGAPGGTTPYHRVKFEAVLTGEKLMGLAGHNLGRAEVALGPDYLREVSQRMGVPFVSANARSSDGGAIAEAVRIVDLVGRRVAVTGVLSPRYATGEVRVDDPRGAVLSAIAPVRGEYDALVVLAYLPEDELHGLAAALPEADVIIGGPTGQAISPRAVGPVLLASATNKGKFVAVMEWDPDGTRWNGRVVEMNEQFHDHAEQSANLYAYLARLEGADFPAGEAGVVPALPHGLPEDYRIAGTSSCVECHQTEYDIWKKSSHAHAFETLQAGGYHVDPYCLSCHTTGFAMPGGFVSPRRTPQLVQVGCENCHGPSQAHVADPKVRTTFNAFDQCIRCHDQENSPGFDQGVYWPMIMHGPSLRSFSTKISEE